MVEACMQGKDHTSIFCFTEIKCNNLNFKPVGLKIFTKHRRTKEKNGGGLMIGFKDDKKTNMEEIKTASNDILALEGTVRGCKMRIILAYMDSDKKKSGKNYVRNRNIQQQIESLLEVEPDTTLLCLGDLNGRMKTLEPNIETDENEKMIEKWIPK